MANFEEKRAAAAAHTRQTIDEILQIARSGTGHTSVLGGSKPHVTISKQVTDYNDAYFRSMLSGIEYATRGHFDQGRESGGYTEWLLRGRQVDVTVRASKVER
jgi:hypothetical protein